MFCSKPDLPVLFFIVSLDQANQELGPLIMMMMLFANVATANVATANDAVAYDVSANDDIMMIRG